MFKMSDQRSFLVARDPSIISYNRGALPKIQIQFDSLIETSDSNENKENEKEDDKYLKVYLRIKGDSGNYENIYEVNNNCLTCRKSGDHIKKNYTFSKIFEPEVNQAKIFNYIARSKLISFINGKNFSLFTYGASSSGKTFTIVGTPEEPGLIPRSLEYLFRSISDIQKVPETKPLPDGFTVQIDPAMLLNLDSQKAFIINAIHTDYESHIKTYKQMQARLSLEPIAEVQFQSNNVTVSVWVSFAEIYNETVYDLLVPPISKGQQRPKLELGISRDEGNTYIKNLTILNVSDGLEAYQILQYGLQNLNYAATAINSHSSRSHCIFSIKLVQCSKNSNDVYISNFNFCDLAGSERLKKTLNLGDRLKESNKINTSLMVLGRCMENIKKYQQIKDKRLIPFRESKLTQIFQKALMGFEKVEMIVNINASKDMFDETIHVLNFSAVAKEIIVEEQQPKVVRKRNRFTMMMDKEHGQHPSKYLKANDSELRMLREKNKCLEEEASISSKNNEITQNNFKEAYEQLLEERDNLVEQYEAMIISEKLRVQGLYKDLLTKRQKMHEKELESLKQEYEQKHANVICISSSESDSDDDDEEWMRNKEIYKNFSRKELIEQVIKLEETLEDAKDECLYLKTEADRYKEAYKKSVIERIMQTEDCENVTFQSLPPIVI